MSNYSINYLILFFLITFALLCKTPIGFAQSKANVNAQNEGANKTYSDDSEVGVLRLDGSKTTSTLITSGSDEQKSFTDKIKVLRVSEGDYDVFFENNGGPYSIPEKELADEGTYHDVFQKAYADKLALQVTVDTEKGQILSVRKSTAASRKPASTSGFDQLPEKYKYMEDILKKQIQTPTN